ncbi:MAG: UDP-N-acetylglucosamine 1-carboxyvinyltransferase [Reyranella sp.]|uniref:UDP-N-acetylglucosamine 1-carboxyvinyltransferase n=1 Tax=Reyranella sp. TaxID=1929291 RepID=UPI001ACD3C59|nr:UDP-N-acetylglucosamine 1-carboxyvinyltransferase [Reyranella sp.]MBN9087096.1 UDP-N-acetylglucosamine 1-carboxyvinyltransferase [Reyranella sp.]
MTSSLLAAAPWWRPGSGRVLVVRGGRPLVGTYPISGAKNAALPLMVSALLTPHLVTLRNVPGNLDVAVLAALLQRLGCEMHWSARADGLAVTMSADRLRPADIDPELVSRMRASVLLLGALLARCGEARLPLPGGDAIGLRGIDFHIAGLRAMGATIALDGGMIEATAPDGLHGADILLPTPSVGATENLMLAAVLANGRTIIRNAACEPEVADLATCLAAMGARIAGIGSHQLTIEGGRALGGAVHAVLPDRIEFGTLACAAAASDGRLVLPHGRIALLGAAAPLYEAAGIAMHETQDGVIVERARDGLRGIDITTGPYPAFATDLQAPTMALLALAAGASAVTETVFEQRFRHVGELRKLGANIAVVGRTALVRGVARLQGAAATCTDVRAAAALIIAGLAADGETRLDGLEHLDRGYDGMAEKLAAVGADIARSDTSG